MTGQVITNDGLKIMLHRTFTTSPTITAPTKFSIGIGTTDPTASDTAIESIVNINGGATKSFVSGYPVLDETNHQATIRCLLNTTEGNGNDLTEFGLFNEDGSALMFSHAVFTLIGKTTGVEVTFVEKDKLT